MQAFFDRDRSKNRETTAATADLVEGQIGLLRYQSQQRFPCAPAAIQLRRKAL